MPKQAITLDHLGRGRFILGVGLGAYREEFEAFGGVGNRGVMLDEMVESLTLLLSEKSTVSYEGKHFHFNDIEMFPKPLTKPFPLYVGGNSPEVLRRAAYYATGWIPASMSLDDIQRSRGKIEEFAHGRGRDSSKIVVAPESICGIDNDPRQARRKFAKSLIFEHLLSLKKSTLKDISLSEDELIERNFIGSPGDIIKKLEPYDKAGIDQMWFDFIGDTNSEVLGQMKLLAKEVMPSF